MKQLELDLFAQARAARDLGLERVSRAADPDWIAHAWEVLIETALARHYFCAFELWDAGLEHTREDRALGPLFMRAARRGIIRKTSEARPSPRSNLSIVPLWESLIWEGAA